MPASITDIIVNFMDVHDLGPTKWVYFDGDNPAREYNEKEKNRLTELIDICERLANNKIPLKDLQSTIIQETGINEILTKELSEKIEQGLKEAPTEGSPVEEQESLPARNNDSETKKTIFSALIK